MAWRRPEAPRTAEEREAARQLGLQMQADMYSISVEEAALEAQGTDLLGIPRRPEDQDEDEALEGGCLAFDLADTHPALFLLLPLAVVLWLVRRWRRTPADPRR